MAGLGQEDLHWACQEANLAEVRAALKAVRKGGGSVASGLAVAWTVPRRCTVPATRRAPSRAGDRQAKLRCKCCSSF